MKKTRLLSLALLLGLLLAACAPGVAPAPLAPAPAASARAAPAAAVPALAAPRKEAWQLEWEQIIADAAREGAVSLRADTGNYRPIWGPPLKKYGVSAELGVSKGSESAVRIQAERRAGIYSVDAMIAGTSTLVNVLKPAGVLDPLEPALMLPEVKNPQNWHEGRLPFLDKDHMIFTYFLNVQPVIAINTNLVKPGEITSYNDLLDPKWSGKLVINDPTISGSSVGPMLAKYIMDWEYLRKLAKTKPMISRDLHQQVDWLAKGKVAIVLGPKDAEVTAYMEVGSPINVVIPKEGAYLSGESIVLINKAPHPNAFRVFINWMLSKEGQTQLSRAAGAQSVRVDVPTDHILPVLVRDPSKKYFSKESEEFLRWTPEYYQMAQEIFKDLR